MMKLAAGAVTVIADIHKGKPKPGDRGETPCPVCGAGKVVWSYGGPRAIRAACTTADCLTFMS